MMQVIPTKTPTTVHMPEALSVRNTF